jgi:hypothetical protein
MDKKNLIIKLFKSLRGEKSLRIMFLFLRGIPENQHYFVGMVADFYPGTNLRKRISLRNSKN